MSNISIPLIIFVLGFITFEVTMGLIVMAVPNRKHHQGWTASDRRKVRRIVIGAVAFWPIVLLTVAVHLYLPLAAIVLFNTALLVGLVLLVIHGVRHRQKRALVEVGHCPNCHYDLVGSGHASHCPECGHEIPEPIRAAALAREAQLGVRSAMEPDAGSGRRASADPSQPESPPEPQPQPEAQPDHDTGRVAPSQPAGV